MAQCRKPRVVVVGAGVIGLSVAVCLIERHQNELDLTIVADRMSPDTTSDHAGADLTGGLWWVCDERRKSWARKSLCRFESLYLSGWNKDIGLHKVHGHRMFKEVASSNKWCFDEFPQYFKELSQEESKALGPAYDGYVVYECTTLLLKCTKYLPWLMAKLRMKGCLISRQEVASLSELSAYDVIINCTGLRSCELVQDNNIFPTRGQSVVVQGFAGIKQFKTCADLGEVHILYIFPYEDHVVVGGTMEPNSWSTTRDPQQDRDIIERASRFEPKLKQAYVIGGWACLRPSRQEVRLEIEHLTGSPSIVHNYGHGGLGVVLSWGCAMETVSLVQQCLREKGFAQFVAQRAKL